jgi:hypothetical protein
MKGVGSKSDQLLQLTGFAVHLRSRLLIRAEEIDPSKLGLPHQQEEQSIRSRINPRFQKSKTWEIDAGSQRPRGSWGGRIHMCSSEAFFSFCSHFV